MLDMDEARAAAIRTKASEEKALIANMDSEFKQDRTPYIKGQLRFAINMLTDVDMLIGWEQKVQPQHAGMWLATAESNIGIARSIRQQVQKLIDPLGDPSQLIEYPR
jgi:hypothetical protein